MHSFYTDDKDISIVASANLFRKSWALSQGSFNVHFSKSRVPVCYSLSNGAFWQRFQVHLWRLLKGVPCLCPIGVLADISKQTPATVQLCNQPDQLSEGRDWEPYPKKKNPSRVFSIFFSQIILLHDCYCQSKGRVWAHWQEWYSYFYNLKSTQPHWVITIFQMYWAASFADKSTKLGHH